MARFTTKHKQEIGLSPDEFVFRGLKKIETVLLRIIDFDVENQKEDSVKTVKDVIDYQYKDSVTWFNIDGLHNKSIMEEISMGFNFDTLILADVMDTQSRPKVHEYGNCIFLSIKMLQQDEETGVISVENLSIILTKSILISFQEKKGMFLSLLENAFGTRKKEFEILALITYYSRCWIL